MVAANHCTPSRGMHMAHLPLDHAAKTFQERQGHSAWALVQQIASHSPAQMRGNCKTAVEEARLLRQPSKLTPAHMAL